MNCNQCPRWCNVDRDQTKGACGMPWQPRVAKAMLHFGEEPVISGTQGSGTVFFAGCNLHCIYCQNEKISHTEAGRIVTTEELRTIYSDLIAQGAHNINLVTPTHFVRAIRDSLLPKLSVPVVYNTSSYEDPLTLQCLEGLIDVYLADLKYLDPRLSHKLSGAKDYPQVALKAIQEMLRQTGPFHIDQHGLLTKGVLIRHLMLPGQEEDTFRVIDRVKECFGDQVMFSLMAQYTPHGDLSRFPLLQHPISEDQYQRCLSYLEENGPEYGFYQEREAATDEFLPDFSQE